jgi:hypothetical protein
MNYDLEQRVRSDLRSNEKLLWVGQPAQGVRFRPADLLLVPFTLLWAGFAVFWEWSVIRSNAPAFFRLWGIPFVLVGLYLVCGRFLADAMARSRTCYALTSQRAVILSGYWTRELKSLWLRNLPEIALREGPGELGSIEFGANSWSGMRWFGPSWPGNSRYRPPAFDLIDQPARIYDLVRSAQREAGAPDPAGRS